VLTRLVEELDIQLGNHENDGEVYDYTGLEAKLPYTTACLREAFRIDPIAAFMMPRCVQSPEGLDVAGTHVPQGVSIPNPPSTPRETLLMNEQTNCMINNHVLHHNPSLYGLDHDTFNPDRFLPDAPDVSARISSLMHFGMGHRACIGRNIALSSMYKIVTTLLGKYDLELVEGQKERGVGTFNYGLVERQAPLWVRAKERRVVSEKI
jgi:cytochrome P450